MYHLLLFSHSTRLNDLCVNKYLFTQSFKGKNMTKITLAIQPKTYFQKIPYNS